MSYTALYRKFRPTTFEDVKGQDHIIKTLQNQIKADRIGHAYLFCGTRGTGKTTVAKIFAKAVNCEHPVDLTMVWIIFERSVRKWRIVQRKAASRFTLLMRCICCLSEHLMHF